MLTHQVRRKIVLELAQEEIENICDRFNIDVITRGKITDVYTQSFKEQKRVQLAAAVYIGCMQSNCYRDLSDICLMCNVSERQTSRLIYKVLTKIEDENDINRIIDARQIYAEYKLSTFTYSLVKTVNELHLPYKYIQSSKELMRKNYANLYRRSKRVVVASVLARQIQENEIGKAEDLIKRLEVRFGVSRMYIVKIAAALVY